MWSPHFWNEEHPALFLEPRLVLYVVSYEMADFFFLFSFFFLNGMLRSSQYIEERGDVGLGEYLGQVFFFSAPHL